MKDQRVNVMFGGRVVKGFETRAAAERWIKFSGNPHLTYTIKLYKR
ncbi:hypothetical protein [Aeromonas phage Aer_P220]|uniref:Uncharacterized protein n=1 Tax=Aeromonas phage Aer_P220 TaxID=2951227 RepID=A0A9E7T0V5_9CAUD|nr:hypothetical protein [Aeromonas phage Aer_P220]